MSGRTVQQLRLVRCIALTQASYASANRKNLVFQRCNSIDEQKVLNSYLI